MNEHPINGLMETVMRNIKGMVDVNTIVGDPVTTPDGAVIIPVSKVSFGFGAGGSDMTKIGPDGNTFGGGSGGGATISPVAFMVANKDQIKLMPIAPSGSSLDKVIDLIPEMVDKVNSMFCKGEKKDKEKVVIVKEFDE